MDSYGIEELSRRDANEYRSKVRAHQHKVETRVLSFKVAGRKVNGRPRVHLVVLSTLCEGLGSIPNTGNKENTKSMGSSQTNLKN